MPAVAGRIARIVGLATHVFGTVAEFRVAGCILIAVTPAVIRVLVLAVIFGFFIPGICRADKTGRWEKRTSRLRMQR